MHFNHWFQEHILWNYYQVNATESHWQEVNIASGDALVPNGTKPSPESMLIKFYDTEQHN